MLDAGVHLICDGGYHRWNHLMCGMKMTSSHESRLWSGQVIHWFVAVRMQF